MKKGELRFQNIFACRLIAFSVPLLGLMTTVPAVADSPADCPSVSLLTTESISGPFRRTQQKFGICYVHASARALDYLNYSTNNIQPRTSILATAMQENVKVTGKGIDLDAGGFQEAVVQHLGRHGGCSETVWDRLPQAEGEAKLQNLEVAVRELNSSLEALDKDDRAAFSKIVATWSPITQEIIVASLGTHFKNAVQGAKTLNPGLITASLQRISRLISEYKNEAAQHGPYRFMSFANYVIEQAFCKKKDVAYTPSKLMHLSYVLYEDQRPKISDLRDQLKSHFAGTKTQPLMLSFYADKLRDQSATTRFAGHAALIVGQEFDPETNTCRYQLLDSSDPKDYDPKLEVDLKVGSLWISLSELHRNFISMTYLAPQ